MIKFSTYNIVAHLNDSESIIYNTLSGAMLCVPRYILNTISGYVGDEDAYDFSDPIVSMLYQNKIITDDEMEKEKLLKDIHYMVNNTKELSLLLHPTLKCNLNCTYCFQQGYSKISMSHSVADCILNLIKILFKQYQIGTVNILWSGGEPLLEMSLIEYISMKIYSILPQTCKVNICLFTNGILLTNSNLKRLVTIGINKIQITIDGLSDIHNSRRVASNRGNNYSIMMRNVDNILLNYPHIRLLIRTNIDKTNLSNYLDLVHFLYNKYKNANFVIYPEFVIGDYNLNKNIIKSQEKSDTIIYLAKHNAYDLDNIFKRPVRFCLKKSKLSFAIGPNGYVYNCETVVGNVRASLGNIQKDTFRFPDKNFILPRQCESCRLLPICTLGCDSNLNGSKCNIMKSREENFLLMFYNQNKSSAE